MEETKIMTYRHGLMVYIFEVEKEICSVPPEVLCLTPIRTCFVPVAGSIAFYAIKEGPASMQPVVGVQQKIWFPKDDCKPAFFGELQQYGELPLV